MSGSWIRADWAAPSNVVAGTTLRSTDYDSLGVQGKPCWLNQVHGAVAVDAAQTGAGPDADASVSADAGHVCVVRTADCLPVLMCSKDGREVAAAHAGWRGLVAGILEATVARMNHDAGDLLAWLGPAISQPAFEVGGEVRAAFVDQDADASACFVANERGRWQADLYGLARQRLETMGVRDISGGGYCTFRENDRFFSYRRNPDCGRIVSFVALEALEKAGHDAI